MSGDLLQRLGSQVCGAAGLRTCSVSAADAANNAPRLGMRSSRSWRSGEGVGDTSSAPRVPAALGESARRVVVGPWPVSFSLPGLRSARRRVDIPGSAGTRS